MQILIVFFFDASIDHVLEETVSNKRGIIIKEVGKKAGTEVITAANDVEEENEDYGESEDDTPSQVSNRSTLLGFTSGAAFIDNLHVKWSTCPVNSQTELMEGIATLDASRNYQRIAQKNLRVVQSVRTIVDKTVVRTYI